MAPGAKNLSSLYQSDPVRSWIDEVERYRERNSGISTSCPQQEIRGKSVAYQLLPIPKSNYCMGSPMSATESIFSKPLLSTEQSWWVISNKRIDI